MWNAITCDTMCQGCAIAVCWRKWSWPHYVKISVCGHLVDTGRCWQLNSLNNPFVLLAPTVPQNDRAGSSGGTQSWRRLWPASSPGGVGLPSPCWEQGGRPLYVLALICAHPGCRRLETAMPGRRGDRGGRLRQELGKERWQRGRMQGMGRTALGRSGCTVALFLV